MRVFDLGGRVFFSVVFVFSAPFLCTKKAIAAEKLGFAACKRIVFLFKCFFSSVFFLKSSRFFLSSHS